MVDGKKMINFFEALYGQDEEIEEMKADLSNNLKGFAENNELEVKSVKSAYSLYKKYRKGKNTQKDMNDYAELSGIIENYFAIEDNKEEE